MFKRLLNLIAFALTASSSSAWAAAPAAPSEATINFTRTSFTHVPDTLQSFHISWRDNSIDEEGFEVQWRPGPSGTFNTLLKLGPNADSSRRIQTIVSTPPLNIGIVTQFRIIAWKLNSTVLESSSLTLPFTIPGNEGRLPFTAPSNLTAIVAPTSDGLINVSWADNSDAEDFFLLQIKESTVTPWTNIGYMPFGSTSLALTNRTELRFNNPNIVDIDLIPGKTYNVTARAIQVDGVTSQVGATSQALPASFVVPSLRAPTNLTGTVTGESTVRLNWTDNSSNETGYEIQYRPVTNGSPPAFVKFGTGDISADSTTVNLNIGQSAGLEFRIAAVYRYRPSGATTDTVILSPFTEAPYITLTTSTFNRPTNLTATTSGMARTVDLTWEDKTETEFGFNILCRPSSSTGAYAFCRAVPENVTKVSVNSFTTDDINSVVPTFTNLQVNTSYDFIVRAVGNSEAVFSLDSQPATATPQQGFTSRMYQPITQNVFFDHTVTTSPAATSIAASGLPPGLSIVPETGRITGTPGQAGRFPVVLTATFSSGPNAVSTLMLRVQPASAAPANAATIANLTIGTDQPYFIPLADKFTDADSETAVRWETTKGNIDFLLYPSLAPLAVANFMAYVNARDYENVFFHRHAKDLAGNSFVLQAGGYAVTNQILTVTDRPSPLNEPGISNLQWTIAAAKRGSRIPSRGENYGYLGNPDSGTTDIFINLKNNAADLDSQNGGFTAYGRVAIASQPTVNAIQALPVGDYGGAISELPVDVTGTTIPNELSLSNFVKINRAFSIPTLSYTVDNQSPNVATVAVENNQLKLTGLTAGTRSVTVTARDLDNKPVTQTFTITVDAAYQTPVITRHPASTIVTSGANVTLSVVATGTAITYKWRRNNVNLTDGNGVSGSSTKDLLLSAVDANDEGSYDVIVSNSNTTLTSDKAQLNLRTPASITGSLPSILVEVGKPLELEANVIGAPVPTCTWRRGTTVIRGQTTKKLSIPAAKLTDAGVYSVTASNAPRVNAVGGGTATVIVIDKNPRLQVAKPGTTVKLTAPVAGPGLTYSWKKGTTDIEANRPRFSGRGTAVLTITAADLTTDSDQYTCTVTSPTFSGSAVTGTIRLAIANKPELLPMIGQNAPPEAFAGFYYEYSIPRDETVSKTPANYRVTGLPKGLTVNAITGLISGVPSAVGVFSISATATNPSGSSITQRGSLRVFPMVRGTTGTFIASVNPSQALNQNHGGRLSLTVSDSSTYSATLQMGAETFRAAGRLIFVGNEQSTQNPVFRSVISIPRKNRPSLDLLIDVVSGSGNLSGLVSDGTTTSDVDGYRMAWNYKHNPGPVTPITQVVNQPPVSKFTYRLNVALDPDAARTDTPQGSGYVAMTVNNDGLATITGRLADDTSITASAPISSISQMFFYQMLNRNSSSLSGFMSLVVRSVSTATSTVPANLEADIPERTFGQLRWLKGVQPTSDRRYQTGFATTILRALGNNYEAPIQGQTVFGIPSVANNLNIAFTQGGLTNNFGVLAALTAQNLVTMPLNNPANVTLNITPSTGSYTGTFEISDSGVKRKVSYNGLIIPAMADSSINGLLHNAPRGAGFFLLPGLTSGSPTKSGRAELSSTLNVSITNPPTTRSVVRGSSTTLTATATASPALPAVNYRWRKNNQPIVDGTGVSGATTASLTLTNIADDDAGSYTCIASSGVFQALSTPTVLTVTAP